MRRLATALLVLGCVAGAAGWWFYRAGHLKPLGPSDTVARNVNWLDHIYSQNPSVAEEAARQLKHRGASAVPDIQEALRNPTASEQKKKAALKACAVLGVHASPALNEVAAHLTIPDYTVEAAVALSFMGRDAFVPLRDALATEDPGVRKESLRSIGKLQERGPLDATVVVPLLLDGLADPDPGVRTVSATYLGIIHAAGDDVVPALVETLQDEDPDVRTAAATALGSFQAQADVAAPALKKAVGDRDENVAREAGVALVKLNKQ
jgi:HEAT repeat protein